MSKNRGLPLGLLVVVAMAMAGCGASNNNEDGIATAGKDPSAAASASPGAAASGSDAEYAARFGECMRDNGIKSFEDPDISDGAMRLKLPDGADKATVDAAMKVCRKLLPNGGEPPKMNAEQVASMRKLSQCMRASGVPNFPDPEPGGGIRLNAGKGLDPESASFQAAQKACAQFTPEDPGGPQTDRSAG